MTRAGRAVRCSAAHVPDAVRVLPAAGEEHLPPGTLCVLSQSLHGLVPSLRKKIYEKIPTAGKTDYAEATSPNALRLLG